QLADLGGQQFLLGGRLHADRRPAGRRQDQERREKREVGCHGRTAREDRSAAGPAYLREPPQNTAVAQPPMMTGTRPPVKCPPAACRFRIMLSHLTAKHAAAASALCGSSRSASKA